MSRQRKSIPGNLGTADDGLLDELVALLARIAARDATTALADDVKQVNSSKRALTDATAANIDNKPKRPASARGPPRRSRD